MENITFGEYRELLKKYKMLITTTDFKDDEFRRIKEERNSSRSKWIYERESNSIEWSNKDV